MRWLTRQLRENAPCCFRHSGGFGFVHLPIAPFNADVLVSKTGLEFIEITAHGPIDLIFHTHAWCGSVAISVNGAEQIESLYAEEHGFKTIKLASPASGATQVTIKTGVQADPRAKGTEVWLAAVDFERDQRWDPRSMPVSPYCTLTRGAHGNFITLSSDTTIGASIVQTGVWAPKDVAFFVSTIKPGMTVLDIGANIGHHSVVYSSLVGAEGRVVAFEPQSVIFRLLAANAAINGCENMDLVQSCVGESEGFVHLYPVNYKAPTNFGALGVDTGPQEGKEHHGERCRVASVDRLLAELPTAIGRCDFIKIDVQSFELFVLRGAIQTLKEYMPTLFLEVAPYWMSKNYDYAEIYKLLWDLGYDIEHPSDPDIGPGEIKQWSGRESEEWDIIARPGSRRAA